MNILLTGAFGNIGTSTLEALLRRGHTVRCFDLHTRTNDRAARRLDRRLSALPGRFEIAWGDLRQPADLMRAVVGQEVVVHLAFIIPKLSATGVESELRPDWARVINVGGTVHLIQAIQAQPHRPRLLFASSYHVYGRTQDRLPPRTLADPVQPIEHYARHKVECERLVRTLGLTWAIFRFAAALPLSMKLDPGMFDIPLNNRMEFVYTGDVGLAIANAMDTEQVWCRTWLIGGGRRCQYDYREIASRVLNGLGLGMLPEAAFSTVPFATDWLDTTESQALLHYQQHDLGDYVRDMRACLGGRRLLVRLCRPLVRRWLLQRSPYWRQTRLAQKLVSGVPAARRRYVVSGS